MNVRVMWSAADRNSAPNLSAPTRVPSAEKVQRVRVSPIIALTASVQKATSAVRTLNVEQNVTEIVTAPMADRRAYMECAKIPAMVLAVLMRTATFEDLRQFVVAHET